MKHLTNSHSRIGSSRAGTFKIRRVSEPSTPLLTFWSGRLWGGMQSAREANALLSRFYLHTHLFRIWFFLLFFLSRRPSSWDYFTREQQRINKYLPRNLGERNAQTSFDIARNRNLSGPFKKYKIKNISDTKIIFFCGANDFKYSFWLIFLLL